MRLRRVWGGINGLLFQQMLHGVDIQPPPPASPKSMGHQHVLEPELRTNEGAANFARHLLTKAAERRAADLYDRMPAAEQQIIADVARAATDPAQGDWSDPSRLRQVDHVDPESGQHSTSWHGRPSSWMNSMMPPYQVCTPVNDSRGSPIPPVLKTVEFRRS
jgi:hypothetical protein